MKNIILGAFALVTLLATFSNPQATEEAPSYAEAMAKVDANHKRIIRDIRSK